MKMNIIEIQYQKYDINHTISNIKLFFGLVGYYIFLPFIMPFYTIRLKFLKHNVNRQLNKFINNTQVSKDNWNEMKKGKETIAGIIKQNEKYIADFKHNIFTRLYANEIKSLNEVFKKFTDSINMKLFPTKLNENQLNELRQKFLKNSEDWNNEEMDVYDRTYIN